MHNPTNIWAIVAAAGIGVRMQSNLPKQYLPLQNQRVIDHALHTLCDHNLITGVVVGIQKNDQHWRNQPFVHPKLIAETTGGKTRAHTVLTAVQYLLHNHIATDNDWVLVHDAVRPCILPTDIDRLIDQANSHGAGALLAAKIVDCIKQSDSTKSAPSVIKTLQTENDKQYWRAMTPQMFRGKKLTDALSDSLDAGIIPRDESAAMERAGIYAALVEGHSCNIKITTRRDLELARWYIQHMSIPHIK